jgi:coproporphyrinogen III oxidase
MKFDTSKIYFKGHSQGGLTGPLFLVAEPEVKAAILSGAGGDLIYSLLNKTEPNNIPKIVQGLVHDPADEFHPRFSSDGTTIFFLSNRVDAYGANGFFDTERRGINVWSVSRFDLP